MSAYLPLQDPAILRRPIGIRASRAWYGRLALVAVAATAVSALVMPRPAARPDTLPRLSAASVSATPALLRLGATDVERRDGFVTVVGEATNRAVAPLRDVEAVVEMYDGLGRLCGVESSLLEFTSLRPGESSPFRIVTRDKSAIASYRVRFRHLLGTPIGATE